MSAATRVVAFLGELFRGQRIRCVHAVQHLSAMLGLDHFLPREQAATEQAVHVENDQRGRLASTGLHR